MIKLVILVIIYFAFPLVIIRMCKHWSFLKKIGSITLAYAFGLLLGTTGILPHGSEAFKMTLQGRESVPKPEMEALLASGTITQKDVFVNELSAMQNMIINIITPLAFPLLLFSLNIRKWFRFAKDGFLSMLLALVSVLVILITGYFIFRDLVPDSWKVAGMLVGIYTGGSPNLASIKVALGVDPNLFIMTSTYDILIGAVTLIFFLTSGPRIFRAILPPFKHDGGSRDIDEAVAETESFEDYSGMFRRGRLMPLLKSLGLAILLFLASYGLSLLLPGISQTVVVILSISTLAIIASLVEWVNRIEKTFQLGMYLIMVFSFIIASMADLSIIFNIKFLGLFAYVFYAYFGSLLLHLLLSKIFRVNADDYLITTTAFVFSPPFVPVIAGALKNKDVIITGITVGIIGYVIGNYLGVALGFFLKGM